MRKYLKRYWVFALLAPLFMAGEVAMDLVQPRIMAQIVDEGVLGLSNNNIGNPELVISLGIRMIALVLIGALCGIMSGVFANYCSQNFGNDIRKDTFSKIMYLSFEQMDDFSTGSLITRVTNDITQLQNMVSMCIRGFVRTLILFVGGIFCMVQLNISFGVVIACALPFVLVCVVFFIAKANPKFSVLQARLDRLNNVMQENVSGSRVVKAYVKEEYEQQRFGKANKDLVDTQLDVLLLFSYMTPIMNIILNLSVVAVIWIGNINVQGGNVTPGQVMAAITYVSQTLNAVMRMTMIFQTVSRGVASGKRVKEILNCELTIQDGAFAKETAVKGKVEFRGVSFAYEDAPNEMILDDFNLTIEPGETLAIMGETGCGKSTLIHLIPRFFDATKGQVLVDDVDVKEYKLETLREKVSIALQKSEIFQMSIRDNIAWGNPEADESQIETASEIAQAAEFIRTKKEGMDTQVSQAGTSLSGGQKQRVAISRAVLKDAEILIFDDATSALDLKTEAQLYEALNKACPNVTKIIVAQRIASVKNADRIVILDDGKLAACGSHEQLLATCKIYQDIYDSQMVREGEEHGNKYLSK